MVTVLVSDPLQRNPVFAVGNSNDPSSGQQDRRVEATVERSEGATVSGNATPSRITQRWRDHYVSRLSADDMASMTDTQLYELAYIHLNDNMNAVARFVLGQQPSQEVQEDVVGNAWVRAWRYLPKWRAQTEHSDDVNVRTNAGHYLRGWLAQICSSMAYDYLRRSLLEKRHIMLYDQYDDHVVEAIDLEYIQRHMDEDAGLDRAMLSELNEALLSLSSKQRRVLGLFVAGYSQDEIAADVGITRIGVKAVLFRVRRHLRKVFNWEG